MLSHVMGYPRIGLHREWKRALEEFWSAKPDTYSTNRLVSIANGLKFRHWQTQSDAGLSVVTTGDFSFFDHVLDTTVMLGLIPERFNVSSPAIDIPTYFKLARGDGDTPAMDMAKWFDTSYHFIVPELRPEQAPVLRSRNIVEDTKMAVIAGFTAKPVLLGPITYLSLGNEYDGVNRWELLPGVLAVYARILKELSPLCEWVQIDEPILCTDLQPGAVTAFIDCYKELNRSVRSNPHQIKLLLSGYYGPFSDNLDLVISSGCSGLHADLVSGRDEALRIADRLPKSMTLSAGIVNGRNVWRTDLAQAKQLLQELSLRLGRERVIASTSCSLLHVPVDVTAESNLVPELKSWLAFAKQKCREVALLAQSLVPESASNRSFQLEWAENVDAIASRQNHPAINIQSVRERVAAVTLAMYNRHSSYSQRKKEQDAWLKLPLLPTTTIGSFPQTTEIRKARKKFLDGKISHSQYRDFLRQEIKLNIKRQENIGLDVLVHGEPERTDMVEYFGQKLSGLAFTENGWIQSFGSRCVKPPFLYGDVARPRPMTVDWIKYAQSLTTKAVKAIVTGPVTILCRSFVRDDLSRAEICKQIALAIRDEVIDLEKAGSRIIQIDEAALREGMPLRAKGRDAYLQWAVDSFRLAASGVADATQIHIHMCYSEFSSVLSAIARMDADVISIEASRSKMELLEAFRQYEGVNEIGPGVYDVHSPRIPHKEEIKSLLIKALQVVPASKLWVNPDCGLKIRGWPETVNSLKNLVMAVSEIRQTLNSPHTIQG